jgi:exonuclease III
MLTDNILILNVRGLISRARQLVVRELVAQERFTLVALQETKLDTCDDSLILEMLGVGFYFFLVPATHTCGGILLAWHRDFWSATNPIFHSSSLTAKLHCNNADEQWWFTCVYGPQGENDKIQFLEQLRDVRRVFRPLVDLWRL